MPKWRNFDKSGQTDRKTVDCLKAMTIYYIFSVTAFRPHSFLWPCQASFSIFQKGTISYINQVTKFLKLYTWRSYIHLVEFKNQDDIVKKNSQPILDKCCVDLFTVDIWHPVFTNPEIFWNKQYYIKWKQELDF